MSLILLLAVIAVGPGVWMALAWGVVLRTGRSGWADTFWSFGVGIAGIAAALVPIDGAGIAPRQVIVAALVTIWALRLGIHIARRTLSGGDDPRYAELRRQWGERYRSQLLLFLEIQAGAALILAIGVLAAARNPAPFGALDALGAVVAVGAMIGEARSDAQLAAFARDPANKGRVCDTGLWARSRHPNYVFEALFWVGCALFGLGIPLSWSWLSLVAPAMMYALLVHVSGIPPLEAHMVGSRGDAFRDYQRRVPAFWPLGRPTQKLRMRR